MDGDGDGIANPFDINDAALATAHYLCVAGGNLRTEAGVVRAILAYNHSDEYLDLVYRLAVDYGNGVTVSGPITGPTTGPLPPVGSGPPPPVNPGPPVGGGTITTTTSRSPAHGRSTTAPAPRPTRTSAHRTTAPRSTAPGTPSRTPTRSIGPTAAPPVSTTPPVIALPTCTGSVLGVPLPPLCTPAPTH